MDFRLSEDEKKFGEEIRNFLKRELTPDFISQLEAQSLEYRDYSPAFTRKLAEKGWIGVGWPSEYGGQGRSYMEQFIFARELLYHRAPIEANVLGMNMVGPSLINFGNEEHKKEYLPRILKGEIVFCLGYTEPGAGSDLASMQTRAEEVGDDYVINGQKTLISIAHHADFCWLGARTDPTAPKKHRGISLFIVDMKDPGITVRPIWTMANMRVNDIFFDEVRVPKSALVGEKNQGFYHIATALDHERVFMGALVAVHRRILDELIEYAKQTRHNGCPLSREPLVRNKLAELAIELKVGETLSYRLVWMLSKGAVPFHEASISKVFTSELEQRLTNIGMQIMGLYGQLKEDSKWAQLKGQIEYMCRFSILGTIGGGTNEIQRSIIALMGLGLPR
jgi:alkylation response protein AidB-like acyl-CoA dehydrogenase